MLDLPFLRHAQHTVPLPTSYTIICRIARAAASLRLKIFCDALAQPPYFKDALFCI
jgi:hypothetical protein